MNAHTNMYSRKCTQTGEYRYVDVCIDGLHALFDRVIVTNFSPVGSVVVGDRFDDGSLRRSLDELISKSRKRRFVDNSRLHYRSRGQDHVLCLTGYHSKDTEDCKEKYALVKGRKRLFKGQKR